MTVIQMEHSYTKHFWRELVIGYSLIIFVVMVAIAL